MTVIINGRISGQQLGDDQPMSLGPARIIWETKDANANALLAALPEGGAVDVPVFIIADASAVDVDLGMFNGVTEPTLAILDDTHARYCKLTWNGSTFQFDTGNSAHQFSFNKVASFLSTLVMASDIDIQFGTLAYLGANTVGDDNLILSIEATNPTILVCPASQRNTNYGKGTSADPRIYITSQTAFATALDQWLSLHHDVSHARFGVGKGDLRVTSSEHRGASTNKGMASTTLSGVTGASVTATGLRPAGKRVIGVSTRILTTLGATGGTTGFQVGDGVDADRYGVQSAITAGSTTANAQATADPGGWQQAAGDVVITAVGGNFDGTGVIFVVVHTEDNTAPSS